jgi:hypothetical protein
VDYLGYRVAGVPGVLTHIGLPELITRAALARSLQFAEHICEHVTWAGHQHLPMTTDYIEITGLAGQRNTVDTAQDLAKLEARCRSTHPT